LVVRKAAQTAVQTAYLTAAMRDALTVVPKAALKASL
jgi:hypothetical protein